MDGPAGNQGELAPCRLAWADGRAGKKGNTKLLDITPGRLAKEKEIAKTISSLIGVIFAKFFSETPLRSLSLKDYPRRIGGVNPKHHSDIRRILRLSRAPSD
jgi:hypothetical protein